MNPLRALPLPPRQIVCERWARWPQWALIVLACASPLIGFALGRRVADRTQQFADRGVTTTARVVDKHEQRRAARSSRYLGVQFVGADGGPRTTRVFVDRSEFRRHEEGDTVELTYLPPSGKSARLGKVGPEAAHRTRLVYSLGGFAFGLCCGAGALIGLRASARSRALLRDAGVVVHRVVRVRRGRALWGSDDRVRHSLDGKDEGATWSQARRGSIGALAEGDQLLVLGRADEDEPGVPLFIAEARARARVVEPVGLAAPRRLRDAVAALGLDPDSLIAMTAGDALAGFALYVPWERAEELRQSLRDQVDEVGFHPVLDIDHGLDWGRPWHRGADRFPAASQILRDASELDLEGWFQSRLVDCPDLARSVPPADPVETGAGPAAPARGAPPQRPTSEAFPRSPRPGEKAVLLLAPTVRSWEFLAYGGFGGFNGCPEDAVHVALQQRWADSAGAELVAVIDDALQFEVARPPQDLASARQLAFEHTLYEGRPVEDETARAESLIGQRTWRFEW